MKPLDDAARAVTMSIGVALYRAGPDSVDDFLSRPDGAMYAAKQAGKNRCVVAALAN